MITHSPREIKVGVLLDSIIESKSAVVSLLKKYRKQPQLKVKYELFVCVLTAMKASEQPEEPVSVLEYTYVVV